MTTTLSAVEFITLDGVMQGFDGPDDDPTFTHGGWGTPYQSPDAVQIGTAATEVQHIYLLGRKTYERMIAFWPHQPDENRMAAQLNAAPKYVASRTQTEFVWNARPLSGELVQAVEQLKASEDAALVILGSGEILRQLLSAGLVDHLTLFIHPLVLGTGGRVFPQLAEPARLALTSVQPTSTGVLVAEYDVV
ncbi:MAG: dihydrofolate reductase family protein [Microbacteriaceae bacterium]|nr:dihydrofolate reductase family protein [Microbacteriaceae bacterium]MCL2794711.1 dihydrofolate reductase family protein [Microbacteriaceae bacterium]